jgi:hypothetical protein
MATLNKGINASRLFRRVPGGIFKGMAHLQFLEILVDTKLSPDDFPHFTCLVPLSSIF